MPVKKSTQFAKFDTYGMTKRPDSIEAEGRIRFLNDVIVFEGTEVAGDEIKMLPLPKGAMIDLARSSVIGVAMSGVTFDLGCNESSDNLANATSLATGGTRVLGASASDLVKITDGSLTFKVAGGTAGQVKQRVSIAYYVR